MAESGDKPLKVERVSGPELRLIDRRAFVGFPELKVAPGVVINDFALQIPDVTFPLNVSGGATRYQRKKLDFGFLELSVDAEVISRKVTALSGKLADLEDLKLHFRPGYLEGQARLRGPERAALTFKVAFDGDADALAVYLYDVRFYAYAATPASRIPALISDALVDLGVLPEVQRRGANGFTSKLLGPLVEQAAVGRGFKMPSLDQARLVEASVSGKGLRLRFAAGGLPPPATPDEELLLTLEGARAFADAEEALANGKLREARQAYLKLGDATEAHPFAAERLLTLLVADPTAHELALDVAQSLHRRRDKSATAIWAEAVVRERRGEFARAAERYLALCNLARKNQEEAGAFFAAEAGARAGRDHAPQMAAKALHELLGIKPDHLPSLKALARASDQAKDRAGAIRAYRRLAALARDPAEAADAHVQLARLCAATEDDIAGARLHCEAALRLAPDHPDALLQLGELCFKSGEHLRAIKALDRLREVAMGRHEVDRIGRANLLAGLVWETGLKQPENALLRYREAASLLPGEPEPLYYAARVAESLGKLQESVAGYQQAIELAGPAPRTDDIRKASHASLHALARLYRHKLGEPARARDFLEQAIALDPTDLLALDELLPWFRSSGKAAELADAAEKAAAVIDDPTRRAALWAEAGELYRGRLAQPDKAERLLSQALEADPRNRVALEGMLALAESRRDAGQLCRCLKALAELAEDTRERVRYYRRLAVAARDLAFDLDLAASAYTEVLRVETEDLPALGELCALQRRRSDWSGLAWALEHRAKAAENAGDKRLAAAVLRELSQVLEARLGRAGEALVALEKAARLFPEANTLMDLATLSLRCERPANARRALEDVLSLLPKHAAPERLAEVRARLGRACELLGDKDAARENYALAFPMRRLDDELAGRLEALYEEGGHERELTDLWASRAQALLQAGRGNDAAPLFFRSAQSLLKAGDAAGAVLRLSAALDAAPQGERAAETLEAMAELELNRGEKLEAAKLYSRRAGLAPEGREAARLFYRAASLAQGTAREETYLQNALNQDLSFVPARLRRAELRFEEDPRTALTDLEAVLEADPKDTDVEKAQLDRIALMRRAGFAALKAGQNDAARRLLALYAAHRPDDTEAMLELAALHRRVNAAEPLVDLLGELWPRLEGTQRRAIRREYAEGSLTLGRVDAAVDALRAILHDEPTDTWAASKLLGLLPAGDGADRERLTLLGRLIDAAEGEAKAELLSRRAELHKNAVDYAAARADLLDAAQLSSRPLPLLRSLAELALRTNDDVAELSAWKLALQAAPKDTSADGKGTELQRDAAERLLAIARSRMEAHDGERAREAFEALVALPLQPSERFDAWYGLARTALANGDIARAESALYEASRQGPPPRRVDALLERASLQEQRQAFGDAVESFEGALALHPRHPQALEGLKRSLRATDDFEGLAEVLADEAAGTPKPQAAPLYRELAALYLEQLKSTGPAEAALKRVVALDENDVASRQTLAQLLAERGEVTEAAQLLEQAAEKLGDAEGAALLRQGATLARQSGDDELALKLARRAHGRHPARGPALRELADLLYLHGAVAEALPLQQAIAEGLSFEDDPEGAEASLLRLADLAEQSEDVGLAETALRRIVRERPWSEVPVQRLASLLNARAPREALGLLSEWALQLAPSPRAESVLTDLARRSRAEGADLELSLKLYGRATEVSSSPLALRQERAGLLRDAGRTGELMAELLEVAQLQRAAGDATAALQTWEEEARLAESLGRIDEALQTLGVMAEAAEEEGDGAQAAALLRRRAALLRDSKLDLDGAQAALERAFELSADAVTAQLGMELARRRSDRDAEIDWLERILKGQTDPEARAQSFVQLAALHLGLPTVDAPMSAAAMLAPDQAEAALKQSLAEAKGYPAAESMLVQLYERQERLADVAAYYEESALGTDDNAERARLLLKAAELYKGRAGRPHEAAAALLAARAASPDDVELTAKVADQLIELGRKNEAADFDAILLEQNPKHASYERHKAYLAESGDEIALAALLMRRAQQEEGETAAAIWLEASQAFQRAGAPERARLCEDQAFEAAPANDDAFAVLSQRLADEPRRFADLLAARARAVPGEASSRLRERAEVLERAKENLLAAEAWDELLAVAPEDVSALRSRAELAAEGGGARAAQPYDRRLLQLAGDSLEPQVRHRTLMRLGHAALEAEAWRDAADAFEQAFDLESDGDKGREALSLLAESFSRARDLDGLYRTTLRLAERSSGDEAEALYRRAATLFDEPKHAIDALRPLVRARPADVELYEKAAQALQGLGRIGELLELHERFAAASGGPRGAQALLEAAALVDAELHDPQKAFELRRDASRLDPENVTALRAVMTEQRRVGDETNLATSLQRLVTLSRDEQAANEARLELAALLESRNDLQGARAALGAVRAGGPNAVGYAQSLEALQRILTSQRAFAPLADVLAARAELASGDGRAALQLDAARSARDAQDLTKAIELARQSLATRASQEGLRLLAELSMEAGQPGSAATALSQAAAMAQGEDRSTLLIQAADAWEAARELDEALVTLQRVEREHPDALSSAAFAARYQRLGAPALALKSGFEPAMSKRQFEQALDLADKAGDQTKSMQALWALAERDGEGDLSRRLAQQLRAGRDTDGLRRLAELTKSTELWSELFLQQADPRALESLEQAGRLEHTVDEVLQAPKVPLLELLLPKASSLSAPQKEKLWRATADLSPARRPALLRALVELYEPWERYGDAAQALLDLIGLEQDPKARASLSLERGELLRTRLADAAGAKAAFERALLEDPTNVAAARALVELTLDSPADFIVAAERLATLAGVEVLEPWLERLAQAYQSTDRFKDAYATLGRLPETTDTLRRRAALAEQIGLTGEALALRERTAESPAELEAVLVGYLKAELVPFAVRLGEQQLERGQLTPETVRLMAERLAPTTQGAALAAKAWPRLLTEGAGDADGWTLFAEALRKLGRDGDAAVADGFGAALTSSTATASSPRSEQVDTPEAYRFAPLPAGLQPVSEQTMPRLWAALSDSLEALGARGMSVAIDPAGGVEAWQGSPNVLVLGVGALSTFGQAELTWLLALALALGESGPALREPGDVDLTRAAVAAFDAFPSSLAAGRVLAQLDGRVRGRNPAVVQLHDVLPGNAAFQAVAQRAVQRLSK